MQNRKKNFFRPRNAEGETRSRFVVIRCCMVSARRCVDDCYAIHCCQPESMSCLVAVQVLYIHIVVCRSWKEWIEMELKMPPVSFGLFVPRGCCHCRCLLLLLHHQICHYAYYIQENAKLARVWVAFGKTKYTPLKDLQLMRFAMQNATRFAVSLAIANKFLARSLFFTLPTTNLQLLCVEFTPIFRCAVRFFFPLCLPSVLQSHKYAFFLPNGMGAAHNKVPSRTHTAVYLLILCHWFENLTNTLQFQDVFYFRGVHCLPLWLVELQLYVFQEYASDSLVIWCKSHNLSSLYILFSLHFHFHWCLTNNLTSNDKQMVRTFFNKKREENRIITMCRMEWRNTLWRYGRKKTKWKKKNMNKNLKE